MEGTVKGVVITVSDRSYAGERPDRSGPLAVELLRGYGVEADKPTVIPDGVETVHTAIREALACGARVIFTTGGTGVTPRDLTPEGTIGLLDAQLPALATQIALAGLEKTPLAGLSRGLVGVTGRGDDAALVVNAPGSTGGVRDALGVIGPLVPHILEQLAGRHDHLH